MSKVHVNTNKELFLGKRQFKALKLTQEGFKNKLNELLESIGAETLRSLTESVSGEFDIAEALQIIAEDMYDKGMNFEDLIGEGERFIAGCSVNNADWEKTEKPIIVNTTEEGFTYIGIFSSVGDDAIISVFNILYFDENGELRMYIPYCGNTVNIKANVQFGAFGGYGNEDEAYEEVFNTYSEVLHSKYGSMTETLMNSYPACDILYLECYGKEFGIDGELPDVTEEKIIRIPEILEIDMNLVIEDIRTNAVVE